jgi:hypothetical protein
MAAVTRAGLNKRFADVRATSPGWSRVTTFPTAWLVNMLVSYNDYLVRAAKLYAAGHDLKNPQLSPIYGDFHGPSQPSKRRGGTSGL